jgi:hypothetical protein
VDSHHFGVIHKSSFLRLKLALSLSKNGAHFAAADGADGHREDYTDEMHFLPLSQSEFSRRSPAPFV